MTFLKKLFGSNKKNKITSDNILSIFKLINYQIKLVDVVCERDQKNYKSNHQRIISLVNSDWVMSYIIGVSTNYISNIKIDIKTNFDLFVDVISDIFHMLKINNSKKASEHKEKIQNFLTKKLYEKTKTDFSIGFQVGFGDYSNFLKISDKKNTVNKIIPLMELSHYLCDELGISRIEETSEYSKIKKKI